MQSIPMDYFPLIISLAALLVSIITFVKKQKSDQFRIALEINDKLEQIANRMSEIQNLPQGSEEEKGKFARARRSNAMENLNTFELFSFLVRNKEITNENIINYFKHKIISETRMIFQDYPDIEKDDMAFEQVKEMLRKWGAKENSEH